MAKKKGDDLPKLSKGETRKGFRFLSGGYFEGLVQKRRKRRKGGPVETEADKEARRLARRDQKVARLIQKAQTRLEDGKHDRAVLILLDAILQTERMSPELADGLSEFCRAPEDLALSKSQLKKLGKQKAWPSIPWLRLFVGWVLALNGRGRALEELGEATLEGEERSALEALRKGELTDEELVRWPWGLVLKALDKSDDGAALLNDEAPRLLCRKLQACLSHRIGLSSETRRALVLGIARRALDLPLMPRVALLDWALGQLDDGDELALPLFDVVMEQLELLLDLDPATTASFASNLAEAGSDKTTRAACRVSALGYDAMGWSDAAIHSYLESLAEVPPSEGPERTRELAKLRRALQLSESEGRAEQTRQVATRLALFDEATDDERLRAKPDWTPADPRDVKIQTIQERLAGDGDDVRLRTVLGLELLERSERRGSLSDALRAAEEIASALRVEPSHAEAHAPARRMLGLDPIHGSAAWRSLTGAFAEGRETSPTLAAFHAIVRAKDGDQEAVGETLEAAVEKAATQADFSALAEAAGRSGRPKIGDRVYELAGERLDETERDAVRIEVLCARTENDADYVPEDDPRMAELAEAEGGSIRQRIGWAYVNRRTPDGAKAGLRIFREALDANPGDMNLAIDLLTLTAQTGLSREEFNEQTDDLVERFPDLARLRSMVAFHAMEGRRLSQDQQRELTMMIRREIMSLRWRSVDSNLTVKSPARTDDDADDTADDAAESDDGAESAEAEGAPAAADSGEQEAGDE